MINKDRDVVRDYKNVYMVYMSFFKQKSNCYWFKEDDINLIYFYNCIQKRKVNNRIYVIND